jgi:olefin beta-lactone synthetase
MTDNSNIVSLFIASANRHLQRTALIQGRHFVSYAQLLNAVSREAKRYSEKGIGKGDRVLVFVPMSVPLYVTVLALLSIGATPVFIDEWVNMNRLKACCQNVKCNALIASCKFLWISWFIKDLRQIPSRIFPQFNTAEDTEIKPVQVKNEDTALITFTTGSTGIPKAANRTHGYLYAQFNALRHLVDNNAASSLITPPIVALINLALGKTTVLPDKGFAVKKPETSAVLADDIRKNNVDEIITSPAIMDDIALLLNDNFKLRENIKYITTGGGSVHPEKAKTIIQNFVGAKSVVVYGSTEAEPISEIDMAYLASVSVEDVVAKGLPVGVIHNNIKLIILRVTDGVIDNSDLQSKILSRGKTGEIVVAGNHVLKSYINNTEAEKQNKIHAQGLVWHRTGDVGLVDENGRLYLKGRVSETIQLNGRVYYPLLVSIALEYYVQTTGALLLHDGRLMLVIESEDNTNKLDDFLSQFSLENVMIKHINHIPKDPRHRTRIDYESLRLMLNIK